MIIPFPTPRTPLKPSDPDALCVGRRVTCHLYGGSDGILTALHGVPAPAEVRALLGGAVLAGGRADCDIAFPARHGSMAHSSRLPEAILYGPQWTLWNQLAPPEEIAAVHAEIAAAAERARTDRATAEEAHRQAVMRGEAWLTPRRPTWATHALIGELQEDQSDLHTDYFASRTARTLLLAWSRHGRDLFSEMRKAAAQAQETATLGPGCDDYTIRLVHDADSSAGIPPWLAALDHFWKGTGVPVEWWRDKVPPFEETPRWRTPYFLRRAEADGYHALLPPLPGCTWEIHHDSIEQREKYSMGHGYYLGRDRHSGWQVRKVDTDGHWRTLCHAVGLGGCRLPDELKGKARRTEPAIPPSPIITLPPRRLSGAAIIARL